MCTAQNMLEHGFFLTIIFSYKGRIWSNTKLPTNCLSDFDQILPSYGKIRVRENPCSSIFYADDHTKSTLANIFIASKLQELVSTKCMNHVNTDNISWKILIRVVLGADFRPGLKFAIIWTISAQVKNVSTWV